MVKIARTPWEQGSWSSSRWSLALIGNASGTVLGRSRISIRGVFDEETRRKPLAFAADAVRYGD